jgi:hypothetical protein
VLEKGKNIPSLGTMLDLAEVFGMDGADVVREVEQQRRARKKQLAAKKSALTRS